MHRTKRIVLTTLIAGVAVGTATPALHAQAAAMGTHRYLIQADFVLGALGLPHGAPACVPNAVFHPGQQIVWRARIRDAATGKQLNRAQINQLGVTGAVTLQGGPTLKMQFEAHPPAQAHPKKQAFYWVAPWKIGAHYPMGPVFWTITVQDKLGDMATFAPIGQDVGIPSIIITPANAPTIPKG